MRVGDLAKELGYADKNAFIKLINDYGVMATSHLSGLSPEQETLIREKLSDKNTVSIALTEEDNTPYTIKVDASYQVKSNVFGELIYVNHKTREKTIWNRQGEIQLVSGQDLKDMRAGQISFYENNLIFILGEEGNNVSPEKIYKALMVDRFYKNSINTDNAEQIYSLSDEQIKEKISNMSDTAKRNLIVTLNEYIRDGQLDSIRKIKVFEEALGCDLLRTI